MHDTESERTEMPGNSDDESLDITELNRIAGYQMESSSSGSPQNRDMYLHPSLNEEVVREIKTAALRATEAVHDDFASPHRKHSPQYYQYSDVASRSHQAQHYAVRDKCDELGVDPGAYYWTDSDSTSECNVHCLDNWPETNDGADHHPDEDRVVRLDPELRAAMDAKEIKEVWKEIDLDEEEAEEIRESYRKYSLYGQDEGPPNVDLNSGMGC